MSDLNDNREGGLFSDDYEIPKRENPYKKKKKTEKTDDPASVCVFSEDKPRETKRENPYKRKSPVKENTEEVENTDVGEAPPVNNSGLYRDERGFHLPKYERSLKDRWDAFIFNHVKLICFIGGVMAVLLFISAPAIYYGIQDAREQAEQEAKDPLTMNYVKGLADKSEPITWRDLVSFPYDETVASDSVTWMIKVKDTDYEVWISGVSTQTLPNYVYLYDMRTGDRADLTEGLSELERFLAGRE